MIALYIALAGGLGAVSRFVVDDYLKQRFDEKFPWATVIINISGSFVLGAVTGALSGGDMALMLGVGFCGGYTTFSTAMFEAVRLYERRQFGRMAFALFGVLILTIIAAFVGYVFGKGL